MAKLLGNTRIYGNAIVDGTITVGNILVQQAQVYTATPSTSYLTGALVTTGTSPTLGGVGIAGNLQVQGNVFVYPGGNVIISNVSTSINTVSGALVVAGGTGIAGNLNVGTIGAISGGFHTVVGNITQSTSGGAVYINTSGNILATGGVFQTITVNGGFNTFGGYLNNSANISTPILNAGTINNAFLQAEDILINAAGNIQVANTWPSTSTTTGAVVVAGGMGISGQITSAGNILVASTGNLLVANATAATSSTTGALRVVGGISSSNGNIYDNKGDVRASPISSQAGATIATAADAGRTIYIATGGVTINASIFSAGDMVTIVNNSAAAQTITAGASVTFRLAGTATTGNRTLAQRGMATFLCVVGGATPDFYCSGAGLT
jgi:hypothetical protein